MANNPYDILGIDKNATEAEIKLAYRKLAKEYHPDLNPHKKDAVEKFKELNNANDLLSDPKKRAAFDAGEIDMNGHPQYQREQQRTYRDYAGDAQGSRYHFSGEDFDLSDFEGIFSGFGGRARTARPSPDAHYKIEIEFLEAAQGATKKVTMPDGKSLSISIPEGIEEGQKLRLKGQGVEPTGDAYVEVHIRPHLFFTRKNKDISFELPISLQDSILGNKIQIPTVHGPVAMKIPQGSSSGKTLRLKGKGIKGGDQYVELKIVMPETIDSELEDFIRKWSAAHEYDPRKSMETVI